MRRSLLLALTVLATPALPAAAQPAGAPGQTVVVVGQNLEYFRNRLAACIARHCPVNEDVDATLALAESLFLNGEYRDARSAVLGSLRRNRGQAAAFPEPVSDLYRVQSRLARHIGYDREARLATFDILRSLRAGLPTEDHRHFTARFEIADMQLQSGNLHGALGQLRQLVDAARAAGREDVVAMAELREAFYQLAAAPSSGDVRARLEGWANLEGDANRFRATGARLMLARLYRREGDTARSDAMFARVAGSSAASAHRRLLFSPRFQLAQQARLEGDDPLDPSNMSPHVQMPDDMENGWIDVGFWVAPDGRVSEVEILRRGAEPSWSQPLLRSIEGRRYTSAAAPTYKIERYTYTSQWFQGTGSRLARRSPGARVEYLDLTTAAETAAATPPRTGGGRPTS